MFNRQQDSDLKYICSTNTIGSMSGTITNNDQLTLTITDPAMNGGIGVPIHVQAMTGDTTATLATKFKNAINMNGTLSGAKITATSSGSNITINSGTGNVTTYSYFNAGGTENMTLVNQGNGEGSTLSTLKYNSAASNWTNLQTAWPGAVSIFVTDSETFAEVFAAQTGGYTDRSFPGGGGINFQSQDWYLQQNPGFRCTWYVIRNAGQSRITPTSGFPAGCPAT